MMETDYFQNLEKILLPSQPADPEPEPEVADDMRAEVDSEGGEAE